MSDRAAKRTLCCCAVRIYVDELMVMGRIGEEVDHRLIDGDPFGCAEFLPNQADTSEREISCTRPHIIVVPN